MVRVNKKPQHIVFCLHFLHQPSKQRHLAVESSKTPCQERFSASKKCPRPDAKTADSTTLQQFSMVCQFRLAIPLSEILSLRLFLIPRLTESSLELVQVPHKAQEWCSLLCKGVEMWTKGTDGKSGIDAGWGIVGANRKRRLLQAAFSA
jgi:hypothetical protein